MRYALFPFCPFLFPAAFGHYTPSSWVVGPGWVGFWAVVVMGFPLPEGGVVVHGAHTHFEVCARVLFYVSHSKSAIFY